MSTEPPASLGAVPQWAADLSKVVNRIGDAVLAVHLKVDNHMSADTEWKADVSERLRNNSQRARAISSHDIDQGKEHEEKIGDLRNAIHETNALAVSAVALGSAAADELAKQSKRWGVGVGVLKWIASTDGRTTILSITTLAGVVYAALKTSGILK